MRDLPLDPSTVALGLENARAPLFWLAVAVFVISSLAVVASVARGRMGHAARARLIRLEIAWTVATAGVVIALAVGCWRLTTQVPEQVAVLYDEGATDGKGGTGGDDPNRPSDGSAPAVDPATGEAVVADDDASAPVGEDGAALPDDEEPRAEDVNVE